MSFFSSDCDHAKLKTNLNLVIQRLKILQKKKTEMSTKKRADIAEYIKVNKNDRARIRCENIIREDYLIEAYELIELFCDTVVTRFDNIKSSKEVDLGLEDKIATIIWAAPRIFTEVPEMKIVMDQFKLKYGKVFFQKCLTNSQQNVSRDVMRKLNVEAIPCNLIEHYMVEIARSFNVPFEPDASKLIGENVPSAPGNLIDLEDADVQNVVTPGIGFTPAGNLTPARAAAHMDEPVLPYPSYPQPSPKTMPTNPAPLPPKDGYPDYPPDVPPPAYQSRNELTDSKPPKTTDNDVMSRFQDLPDLPEIPGTSKPAEKKDDDAFDDLAARFNRLKEK